MNLITNVKPFLRWAGGKKWLINYIQNIIPESINNYHEPFLGGASIYFSQNTKNKSYLSDINSDLINTYIQIRDNLPILIEELSKFKNTKTEYYKIRNTFYDDETKKAAKFLFLNRTSYNGIYRVNKNGIYNVPYGNRKYKILFDTENLKNASLKLQNSIIKCQDFQDSLIDIKKNDLVFLDPPYTVMHNNNGFIKYNEKLFTWNDQIMLLNFIKLIIEKKAYFIMTNAAHLHTKKLFKEIGNPIVLKRQSSVGGKHAQRKEISEFLFTNCSKIY